MSPADKPAEPADPASEPADAASEPADARSDPADAPAGDATGPAEDVREKFREALARKKGKEKGVPHHADQPGSAGRSQDAKTQRMFRRKSG